MTKPTNAPIAKLIKQIGVARLQLDTTRFISNLTHCSSFFVRIVVQRRSLENVRLLKMADGGGVLLTSAGIERDAYAQVKDDISLSSFKIVATEREEC